MGECCLALPGPRLLLHSWSPTSNWATQTLLHLLSILKLWRKMRMRRAAEERKRKGGGGAGVEVERTDGADERDLDRSIRNIENRVVGGRPANPRGALRMT